MPHPHLSNDSTSDGPDIKPEPSLTLAHITEQPGLPIKFDSKRGCDQIRARLYHDSRVVGLELEVALALSEFTSSPVYAAYPKQKLLARMVHATRPKVSGALSRLEAKGVLEIDRCRTHCRYIFLARWLGHFHALPGGQYKQSRCSFREHLDVPERNISSNEPYVLEPLKSDVVASTDEQQQQLDPNTEDRDARRAEGLIAAIATRSRQLDKPFDETATRAKLASGETTVQHLQVHADFLKHQLADQHTAAVPCGRVRNCPKCDTDDRGDR